MQTEQIVYRELESPLGTLIAGVTSKGCCFLEFVDRYDISKINQRMKKHYDNLELIKGTNATLDQLELELKQYFNGDRQEFSIPLDLQGTSFQQAVWSELLKVPYGEVRSYLEIANEIKNPLAVRAVGMANGKNPMAIVVPCHRVIQSNGKLGGYGGGLGRKKHLLTLEGHKNFGSQGKLERWVF
ncbi:MAG: methylated-DNA--[protein]-cysteine S-methyltransferase [Candidatus Heimdallarchaeota archaeon]